MKDVSDSKPARWLGPGELSRRLGISVKTLRVYERAGLVAPARREGGWRSYGPADIARLHEVLALRSLGLSLAEVKAVLESPASSLERTLDIQQRHLLAQIGAAQKRLAVINAARRRLLEDGDLGIDDLLALANETAVAPPIGAEEVEAIIHGLARDHDSAADLTRYVQDVRGQLDRAGITHADFERALSQLVADAGKVANLDPATEPGREIAERWLGLVGQLEPRLGLNGESVGEGVSAFAAELSGNADLAAALTFLRRAVAAHNPRKRGNDR